GVSVLFSCEYNFTDDEYQQMQGAAAKRAGQNYFTFSVNLFDKNNELVYNANDYANYKRSGSVASSFATTVAVGSQVRTAKPEPRRSTGIELFIPYAHLDLPEGANDLKVAFSAYAGNSDLPGKKFENFHLPTVRINKPPAYWIKLTPRQLTITDKAGKKSEASQIAEDFAVGRGNDPAFADLVTTGSGTVGTPATFVHSEGDAMQLRTQPERGTTGQLANRQRPVKGTNGQTLTGFEGGIRAEGPLDLKASPTATLRSNALTASFAVEKTRIPAVRIAGFKVNRYVKFEGATGASLGFTYEADVAKTLPDLVALPAYNLSEDGKGTFTRLRDLKVMSGNATVDTSGTINLGHNAGGKVEIFFPYAGFLLRDEATRKRGLKHFRLEVRLRDRPERITQKNAKQSVDPSPLKDAVVAAPVTSKEIVLNNSRGVSVAIPYQIPALYADLLVPNSAPSGGTPPGAAKGGFAIQLTEVIDKTEEPRLMGFLRKTTVMNEPAGQPSAKRLPASDKGGNSTTYLVDQPAGNITLFVPYAGLALTENASPMKFLARISVNGPTPLELGTTSSALKLDLDEKKLRFLTVGVSGIRMKEAGESIAWRIRSADGLIYQSPLIPAEKKMENFYAHNYCASEEDKVVVEVLKGTDLNNLKEIAKWELPVKALKPSETVEIVKEDASPDGNVRNVAVTYRLN
ncbi:MAG: hypothetical protein H7Z75_19000, partial [Ferruginibacter sp.]|nr:hypothetical protein [Cytophagales bacterium]